MPDPQPVAIATVRHLSALSHLPPADGPGPSGKSRRHYHEREYCGRHVRLIPQFSLYQLRVFLPAVHILPGLYVRTGPDKFHGFSVNCGLFPTPRAAKQALAALQSKLDDHPLPIDVWHVVVELQEEEVIPMGRRGQILPLWVRRAGSSFVGVYERRDHEPFRTRTVPTAETAHRAVWRHLQQMAAEREKG